MIKPQLRPTADQTFEIVADPQDRNWDFVGILARSRREEQQGNIEAACNTRYHAVQRLEELLPESGEVIFEWEDDNSQAALEVVYCSAIDHFLIGDWEMAAAMFEMLLELDPEDHLEATIRLAYTYLAMEEYDSFDEVINDISDKTPDRAILLLWSEFRRKGTKLLIAGEFYASHDKYIAHIERLGLNDEVILHDFFVPDSDVRYYFSAADCVVLPYKTATQSGVTQICYNFCTPVIVTDVGGLAEIVPHNRVGYVCTPSEDGILNALENIYKDDNITRFAEAMVEERKRFSWSAMCDKIEEVYRLTL